MEDLKEIWQSATSPNQITIDMSQLLHQFKTGMERREAIVRRRDRKEIFFASVGILGYTYIAFYVPFTIARVGAILIVATYLFYIYKLRNNRKSLHTQGLFLPLQDQLKEQRTFITNQAQLLDTVAYWFGIPLFISLLIFVWGTGDPASYDIPELILDILPITLTSKLIWSIVTALLVVYVAWINKRAVVVNWKPLIDQIDNIISQAQDHKN